MVTDMQDEHVSFEGASQPQPVGGKGFLSDIWDETRDSGIAPLHQSKLDSDQGKRQEFISGATALGLVGRSKELKPQQLRLADVCAAPWSTVGVLLPRRSSKTTSIFAIVLGRCLEREDYLVAYTTCTTGMKARDRFRKDLVPVLERMYPDQATRPFKIRTAGGSERIVFDNGSIFQVLPPMGESFRSDAFDCVVLDEAGEASPEMTEDLLAGILPTFDTREDAQLIVAGTAAQFRKGNLLWETLEDGRNGVKCTGILEYAAPDETSAEALEDWDFVKELVLAAHPGVGTLTTLDRIEERHGKLKPQQFAEEYLSIFGNAGATAGIIDAGLWAMSGRDGDLPTPPSHFALAIAVHRDGLYASIAAAWREESKAHLLILGNGKPAAMSKEAARLAKLYRTPIVHDTMVGATMVEVEGLQRARPKPRLSPQTWANVATAASLLVKEVTASAVVHYSQPDLNEAVRVAVKRGTPNSNRWAFGTPREDMGADITPLEASALALRAYDETPRKRTYKPIVE